MGVTPGSPPLRILGVRVDPVTMNEALRVVDGFLVAGGDHHVVTVNPEYIVAAGRDSAFRGVLNASDLALVDGIGVALAARWLGSPVPGRVTGVDIVPRMAAVAARRGAGVFLLGARPGVAERAAEELVAAVRRAGAPPLDVRGCLAGNPDEASAADIVARVRAAAPGMLLVAFGAPRQDMWIARHRHELRVPVMMGVGGTFDFLAGEQRRAPAAVRRAGLEWLWRLVLEPWRWRRQMALPVFAVRVALEGIRRRVVRGESSADGPGSRV